ncbi:MULTISPECIES: AMP-binding protein [Streptacidiphilus]|uniref:AMP-binding protein n=1 Tax=Streptacidiphilus cavernicola TaxID=3342716 RepID=A0ABV6UEG1_9ACTN|nr:AMP-binding protein [Streptacidiphilus jeojiense]
MPTLMTPMDPHADPLRAADQVALHWLGDSGEAELYTFDGLEDQVRRAAAVFRAAGVGEGDAVLVFLPAMPEAVIATLACERLRARVVIGSEAEDGAVTQSTVAGPGATAALRELIRAERPQVVVTADAVLLNGRLQSPKAAVDRALRGPGRAGGTGTEGTGTDGTVGSVLVVQRNAYPVGWTPGRDRWWHQALAGSVSRRFRTPMASVTSSSSKSR